jgi:hypothetical protein
MQLKLRPEIVITYNLTVQGLSYDTFFILQREHNDTIVLE